MNSGPMIPGFDAKKIAAAQTPLTIGNVPPGMEPLIPVSYTHLTLPTIYSV